MNPSSWWIGEPLEIISSGLKVRYQGPGRPGNILIRMPDGEIREAPLKDIRESGEDQEEENGYEELPLPEVDRKTDRGEFGDQLDLHYEALIQNHTPTPGKSILEFQLEICRQFILESIQRKRPHIRIIHGRGSGVLKKEVEALLKNHPEVSIISFNPFSASVDVVLS